MVFTNYPLNSLRMQSSYRRKNTPPICQPKFALEKKSKSTPKFLSTNRSIFSISQSKCSSEPKITYSLSKGDGETLQTRIIRYTTQRNPTNKHLILQTIPFQRAKQAEMIQLFIAKCNSCMGFCDFSEPSEDTDIKKIKTETFEQLYEFITNPATTKRLTQECIGVFFKMFLAHIIRPIPYIELLSPKDMAYDNEWPHLQSVYKMFISIIENSSIRPTILQSQISPYLINTLFSNLTSPDLREQRVVCNALMIISQKFIHTKRTFAIKSNSYIAAAYHDKAIQQSLNMFLEFYSYSFPTVRQSEFRRYVAFTILPLMQLPNFETFYLSYFETLKRFCSVEPSCVEICVKYFLKHWPITDVNKQLEFLDVFEDMLPQYSKYISRSTSFKLLKLISLLFNDATADLSQRSLSVVCSDGFKQLITINCHEFATMLYIEARYACQNHWIDKTRGTAVNVLFMLERLDPPLKSRDFDAIEEEMANKEMKRMQIWDMIKAQARGPAPIPPIAEKLGRLVIPPLIPPTCSSPFFENKAQTVR